MVFGVFVTALFCGRFCGCVYFGLGVCIASVSIGDFVLVFGFGSWFVAVVVVFGGVAVGVWCL